MTTMHTRCLIGFSIRIVGLSDSFASLFSVAGDRLKHLIGITTGQSILND